MSRLSDLIGAFTSDGGRSTLSVFPDINVKAIAGKLALEKEGAKRGAVDQPAADQNELDPIEQSAIGEVARLRRMGLEAYEDHIATYARRLDELVVARAEVATIAETAVSDYRTQVTSRDNHLYIRARQVIDVERQLARFRERHGIEGPARPRMALPLQIGILLALVAIESGLNGYYFAQGNAFGLIGGVSVALSVSIVNVGFAWLFGRAMTSMVHRFSSRRLFGLLALVCLLAWTGGINLLVAHFRDAASGGVPWEQALRDAVTSFLGAPFGLANFESWILALFGALISISSAWKGWSWDDPYPGYGALYRNRMRFAEDYADAVDRALGELQEQRDEACADLDDARRALIVGIRESADVLTARSGLTRQAPLFLQQADQAVNHLLSIYRDANRAARSAPPPDHFSEAAGLPQVELTAPVAEGVDRRAVETREAIEKVLDDAIGRIFTSYTEAVGSFRSLVSLDREAARPADAPETKAPSAPAGAIAEGEAS